MKCARDGNCVIQGFYGYSRCVVEDHECEEYMPVPPPAPEEWMPCDCDDWKTSMEQIVSAQAFSNTHGITYTGETFRFCPWCGKKLVEGQP